MTRSARPGKNGWYMRRIIIGQYDRLADRFFRLHTLLIIGTLAFVCAITVLLSVPQEVDAKRGSGGGSVHVRGYFRSNGTYVAPHMRSAPDGNPYNNWSFPGNVNPYTGKVATGDPLVYLERYYRSRSPGLVIPAPTSKRVVVPELDLLPGVVHEDELRRAQAHCDRIYGGGTASTESCELEQFRSLARTAAPDYTKVNPSDMQRSAGYCEWLYGDNRAGFYSCFNSQVLGLHRPQATFTNVPANDRERATRYCEWLYGDNRAGMASCLNSQSVTLERVPVQNSVPSNVSPHEWDRASRYCEWLYGDNRAGMASCLNSQTVTLSRVPVDDSTPSNISADEWQRASRYCEWLHGNNRAGAAQCLQSQRATLLRTGPAISEGIPNEEWNRANHYCEWLYSENRAGVAQCRTSQASSLKRIPWGKGVASTNDYCEGLYGDNRSGFWSCALSRR